MMTFLIFCFLLYGVASADLQSCVDLIPDRRIPSSSVPDLQELRADCPHVLNFLECFGKEMDKNPDKFDESNRLFRDHLGNLIHDLCDEESQIHKDYLASIDCFENVTDKFDACLEYAKSVYRQYKMTLSKGEGIDEIPYDENECFPYGHAVGCMSNEILQSCGPMEQRTYVTLVSRSRYLGKFCQPDTAENLRTKYLDHLNLSDNLRDIYQRAFEYET